MELGRGVKDALGNPFMPECSLNLRFIEAANSCSFLESRKTYLKVIRWPRAVMSAIGLP